MTESRKKIDEYFAREYGRLLLAANNILGRGEGQDALHSTILNIYEKDEDAVADMADTDYLTFYIIRSLSNAAAQAGRHASVVRSNERNLILATDTVHYEEEHRSLAEVVACVADSSVKAVRALLDEMRLSQRLNTAIKYKTQAFDRIVYSKHVCDGMSFRSMENNTGIPRSTLYEAFVRVRRRLADEERLYRDEQKNAI